jgi:hypothetical protein
MIAVVVIWRTNYTVVKEALDAMMILAGVLISRRH